MKKLSAFIIILACVLICASRAFAWSDDVEGMLMPSPRGEDNISDPEAILENIEAPADMPSENAPSTVEWQ